MSKIYVVPTPIGNLNDISKRSLTTLKEVKHIFCEDTKVTGKLKHQFNLEAKLYSLHKYNEKAKQSQIEEILRYDDIAIVSDAGTPTISDPGQITVNFLKEKKYEVIPLPGPNAITTALSGSGLSFETFSFIGFLKKEEKKIDEIIKKHINSDVIVAYESPNRINKTLEFLYENYGNIEIVIARELTKIYEEIIKGRVSTLYKKSYKGEIVLMIPTQDLKKESKLEENVWDLLNMGLKEKDIIKYLVKHTNLRKNNIYNYMKTLK